MMLMKMVTTHSSVQGALVQGAAARGVQVRLLVEEGGADVLVKDRWGKTPHDEAVRVGARFVVEYLEVAPFSSVSQAAPFPLSPPLLAHHHPPRPQHYTRFVSLRRSQVIVGRGNCQSLLLLWHTLLDKKAGDLGGLCRGP